MTNETKRLSIGEFCGLHLIALRKYVETDRNPILDPDASRPMDHWRVTLTRGLRGALGKMTLVFSKGVGLNGAPPTLNEVVAALADDSAAVENNSTWEDFAREYAYDTDSRSAHKLFLACQRQSRKLRAFLGDTAFEQLLWNTDHD